MRDESKILTRRDFVILSALFLSHCATRDRTQRFREGDNTGQQTSLTPEEERKLTEEVLPQMSKDYPPINDESLQEYLNSLGNELVVKNGLAGNPYQYRFTLVGTHQVNAFALPAGEVFVTAPLLMMCESEAELVGVLGHEIGHIQARHTAERMERAKKEQSQSWKYAVGGGLLGAAAGLGLGKLLCPPQDRTCMAKAVQTGAGLGAMGGLLVQKYGFMQNSQEDELEADRIGFRLGYRANYHKDHIGRFYNKLYELEQKAKGSNSPNFLTKLQDAMSTHPPSRERVQQMEEMRLEVASQNQAKISSNEFEEVKKRLKKWVPN